MVSQCTSIIASGEEVLCQHLPRILLGIAVFRERIDVARIDGGLPFGAEDGCQFGFQFGELQLVIIANC